MQKISQMRKLFNKSINLNRDLKKGEKIKLNYLKDVKPNIGLSANNFEKILGKKIKKNLMKNKPLKFQYFE